MQVKMARPFRSYRQDEVVDVSEELAAAWVELCVATYAEPEVAEPATVTDGGGGQAPALPDGDGPLGTPQTPGEDEELNGRLSEALGAAGARIAELEGLLKEAAAEVERLTAAEREALAAAEGVLRQAQDEREDGSSASEATEEPSSRDPAATAEPAKATKKGK